MYQKLLLSEKIAETIKTSIKQGFYKPGDQMPNELELAEELGVSRATLREAIKILISKNVLTVKRGIGTFISNTPGFSSDNLGYEFVNLKAQKFEIFQTVKQFDLEECLYYEHLPFQAQEEIMIQSKVIDDSDEPSINDLIEWFHILEKIALTRGASFKFRLLIISHEAFLNSLDGKIDPQFIEKELLKKVISSLGNGLDKTALQAFYNKLSLCL